MVGERAPVILVPGAFGQDFVYWNVMEYLLERDGFPTYSITFPVLTLTDLRASADLLKTKVDEVCASEGVDRVQLIAHSMGGLISRYYVRFLGGEQHVERMVLLGVPHKGTWTGLVAPVLRGTRQILPGSAFLNALNAPGEPRVPTTNIYSKTDFIVFPPSSAEREEKPHLVNKCAPWAGHWGLLVSPQVYKWIREALHAPIGGALDEAGEEGPARAAAHEKLAEDAGSRSKVV